MSSSSSQYLAQLDGLARARCLVLHVTCEHCGNSAKLEESALLGRTGPRLRTQRNRAYEYNKHSTRVDHIPRRDCRFTRATDASFLRRMHEGIEAVSQRFQEATVAGRKYQVVFVLPGLFPLGRRSGIEPAEYWDRGPWAAGGARHPATRGREP
jgi:hypothetical protein